MAATVHQLNGLNNGGEQSPPLAQAEAEFAAGMALIEKGEGTVIEGQIACGAALNHGRKEFVKDEDFGKWVCNKLLLTDETRPDRAAWMWAAANPDQLAAMRVTYPRVRTLRGWHEKWKEQSRPAPVKKPVDPEPVKAAPAPAPIEPAAPQPVEPVATPAPKPVKAAAPKAEPRGFVENNHDDAMAVAKRVVIDGLTLEEAAAEVGSSAQVAKVCVAYYRGVLKGQESLGVDYTTIPGNQKEKWDRAIARHEKHLNDNWLQAVYVEANNKARETLLPDWLTKIANAKSILERHQGVMTEADYKTIKMCLHPDSNPSPERKDQAFQTFSKLELKLIPYRDQTGVRALPTSMAELMAAKAKVIADRAAARAAKKK
jgi:hypothetical protein